MMAVPVRGGPGRRRRRRLVALTIATIVVLSASAAAPGVAVAQEACLTDAEPDDTPEAAPLLPASVCVEGELPDGDQDLAVWEVTAGEAATLWTISVAGVPGTLTALKLFEVTSPPGAALMVQRTPFLEVATQPEATEPSREVDVLMPLGRYLLGISRSALQTFAGELDIGYSYRIERGSALPPDGDREPNDDAAGAVPVSGAFELSGDLDGSEDRYAWTVEATDMRWQLDLLVPIGEQAHLELSDPDGTVIDTVRSESRTVSYDLELSPGLYTIAVGPRANDRRPYVLRASMATSDGDREPNDRSVDAVPVAAGTPIGGRLAGADDRDRFALAVPAGVDTLHDVRVIWRSGAERTLCLVDGERDVLCRRGAGGVALDALALGPGRHDFEIRGPEDPDDAYVMRIDPTSAAVPDYEREPNDEVARATLLRPDLGMRGRGGEQDDDVFQLHTAGEPQLWEISIAGSGIRRAALVGASGRVLESAHVDGQRSSARLTDLYLVPGDHWFVLAADAGEYEVRAIPLGPPSPDAEREPNSSDVRSERYRIGSTRTGRLPTGSDRDFYRFTLAAPQRIGLHLEPPDDGSIGLRMSSGEVSIWDLRDLPPGEAVDDDLWLQPGDYLLELLADQPSEGRYTLTSERLDPFDLAADQEPNDGPAWARETPASLAWQGDASDRNDEDWFALPPLSGGEPLELAIRGETGNVRLYDADSLVELHADGDGGYVAPDPPRDVPLLLAVPARGPYEVRVGGGGLVAADQPPNPPLEVAWSFEDDLVAAYWPQAQRIEGSLTLLNALPTDVEVGLEAVTSHFLWRASPAEEVVSVPAGGSASVPVTVDVGADAWADEPVLVAIQATTDGAAPTSATATLSASVEASPLLPHVSWPLPSELLGGLNAASLGLGAVPGDTVDSAQESELYDGVTPDRAGFTRQVPALPLELVVDLAGDRPIPVAGTIVNPQAGAGRLRETPRTFELLLSMDGTTWEPALEATLSPLPIDQAFVLDEPVEARHAMLRITSMHGEGTPYVSLGEWKVVLRPGVTPTTEPLDIAAASVGGHVVRLEPQVADDAPGQTMLDEDPTREFTRLDEVRRFETVLGFHEGRAARIERLEWIDPDGSRPDERLERVEVSTSLGGPAGPWGAPVDWELVRAADGSVASMVMDPEAWVRYIRLRGMVPEDARAIELPGQLRVIEHATDDAYRSIVGEWGYTSSAGPFEWLATDAAEALAAAPDAADRREEALPLAAGVDMVERVEIDVDEDWYSIEVPTDRDTLELVVRGRPTVRVALELFATDGTQRPVAFSPQPDGSVRYQAAVEAGQRYDLRVHQPPFSAVFTFDTSGSMAHFLDTVIEGIRSFAADVQPGREAVSIVPFEAAPLLPDWQDDAYLLQDAVNRYGFDGSSSGSEAALIAASDMLQEREGARAILIVTDAETSTYLQTADLWARLQRIRPIIFSVHVGGAAYPREARHRMQDWAASGGGHYAYPTSHGEMDRAFDRMAAWLRRPADYRLSYETLNLGPGLLAVRAGEGGLSRGLAPGVGVEIILDTSGSMRERLEGRPRIEVAREALEQLLGESLEEGVPVALRTFGGKGNNARARCQTRLTRSLEPLDRQSMLRTIDGLRAERRTKTPLAAALAEVDRDLAEVTGARFVVLVTDGAETCGGDPGLVIEEMRAAGVDVTVNIVGFALDDEELKSQMAGWAETADGHYFDASGADDLATALAAALSAPFRAYGPDGGVYEGGTVGGPAIAIDPGTYRVEVLTDPPVEFDEVVVGGGEEVTLELPPEG